MTTFARSLVLAAGSALLCVAAHAATPAGGGCNPNEARNDPAACKRESGAAAQEAKRGGLTSPGAGAEARNEDSRCSALSGSQRADCMSRVTGSNGRSGNSTTTTTGSVQSGGTLSETTTIIPAQR